MTLLWPPMLLSLLLVPLGVVVARAIDRRRGRRLEAVTGSRPLASGGTARDRARARIPTILLVTAFVLLALALSRPQATVSLPRPEGTVILTFDVSGSMVADDLPPTRMDAAKAAARAIVEHQPPGVVVGIVAFSDAGIAVHAPSSDREEVLAAIERLAPSRGTSVGQGILASLTAIEKAAADTPRDYYSNRSPAPTTAPAPVPPGSDTSSLIVLLTDGENNERPDPIEAARAAADRGIRIMTIGVGSTAGTTVDLDGFQVHTSLDEAALRRIADTTAGAYHPADDTEGLATVLDGLGLRLVVRSELLELTALLAGTGVLLLVVGSVVSLAISGRLP